MSTHDIAIIGAGPIGIELAVGLKQAGADYIHLEAGCIGATMHWWAPHTRFFSSPERIGIAGVPIVSTDQSKATREGYLTYLRGIVQQFELPIHVYTRVMRVAREGGEFVLHTSRTSPVGEPIGEATEIRARNIVLAIGDMHRPRMLNVPGEDLPHVSHYFDDPHVYFGRRVLIVGGKNSVVEAAVRLYRANVPVTISYRGDRFDPKRIKYWLLPEIEWLIEKNRIEFLPRTVVTAIHHRTVELADVDTGRQTSSVDSDAVLLLTGYEQDQTLFEQLGVEVFGEERRPQCNCDTMETNVPGVYVAGTAAAGSQQRTKLFIENSHVHVARIVKALTGVELSWVDRREFSALAES